MTEAEHTPGPWRWEVNEKSRQLQLCGGDPKGGYGKFDLTVMDFVRWGMTGAAPRFVDKRTSIARMTRADEFAVVMKGREHHASWFKLLSQPDADLIAAAPRLLKALRAVVAIADRKTDEFDEAHAAIAEAEGRSMPSPMGTKP